MIIQTVVTLTAATSAQLVGSNTARKALRWMNIGANPMTVVPGKSAAVVGAGFQYNGASATGDGGGEEIFHGEGIATDAFQAISTLGTTVVVWENE